MLRCIQSVAKTLLPSSHVSNFSTSVPTLSASARASQGFKSSRHRLESRESVATTPRRAPPAGRPPFRKGPSNSNLKSPASFSARSSRFVDPPRSTQDISSEKGSQDSRRSYQPRSGKPVIRDRFASGFSSRDGRVALSKPEIDDVPPSFQDYPLLPGLQACLKESLGPKASPFPIQLLSLQHFLSSKASSGKGNVGHPHEFPPSSSQTLLGSETGSGKSIAYLLPVIQALKSTEAEVHDEDAAPSRHQRSRRRNKAKDIMHSRALILAPTHELCRQLATYTKTLSHNVKLRTVCLSNPPPKTSASQMLRSLHTVDNGAADDFVSRQPDIVIGTPSKFAQMAGLEINTDEQSPSAMAKSKPVNKERERSPDAGPSMSLDKIEWIVIDEADVLFDRDFRQLVHGLLDAISISKNVSVPRDVLFSPDLIPNESSTSPIIAPPYNLILTTATIPSSLNTHLLTHFPNLIRLTSPNLHKLPRKLQTERVDIKGVGNPLSAIHRKLVEIFANETRRSELPTLGSASGAHDSTSDSRVILFCNHAKKADEIGAFLNQKKMHALVMTGTSEGRKKGSNNHLEAFLNSKPSSSASLSSSPSPSSSPSSEDPHTSSTPRILITTSLLARGLDFSPSVTHVLIVDEPRNEVDFLHRAGRTGRAGRSGTVVVFGKGIAPKKTKKKMGF